MSTDTIILIVAAYLTSTLSGIIGMAGGVSLLTVMAQFFPLQTLIPLHGITQLASNSSRTLFTFKHLNKTIFKYFTIGVVFAAILGTQINLNLPEREYKIGLGILILMLTFRPKLKYELKSLFTWTFIGSFITLISLFVGAGGPFLAPFFLNKNLSKEQIISTKAACQTLIHTGKILVFFYLGFQIQQWLPLLAGMVPAVILGSWTGTRLLGKVPEKLFLLFFKLLIVALALRMIILSW